MLSLLTLPFEWWMLVGLFNMTIGTNIDVSVCPGPPPPAPPPHSSDILYCLSSFECFWQVSPHVQDSLTSSSLSLQTHHNTRDQSISEYYSILNMCLRLFPRNRFLPVITPLQSKPVLRHKLNIERLVLERDTGYNYLLNIFWNVIQYIVERFISWTHTSNGTKPHQLILLEGLEWWQWRGWEGGVENLSGTMGGWDNGWADWMSQNYWQR